MTPQSPTEFRTGVVHPIECLREGLDLIRDQYWLFVGIVFVGMLIASIAPLAILMGPMMCGIHLCLFAKERREVVRFDQLFRGFDFFGDSLIATLIQIVPMLVLMVQIMLVLILFFLGAIRLVTALAESEAGAGGVAALLMVAGFFIVFFLIVLLAVLMSAFFVFSYQLIVERRLSGLDAVKTSAKAVRANLGGVVGLLLLIGVLNFVGLLFLWVGAILVGPIGVAGWTIAYRRVFGPAPPIERAQPNFTPTPFGAH